VLAILILAQTVSSPTPAAAPDDGPPPPSIVERIGSPPAPSPYPAPSPSPVPLPVPSPTPRAAAPPVPLPEVVPVAPPTPVAARPKATATAAPAPPAAPVPAAAPKAPTARGSAFGVHVSSFRKRTTAEADARRLGAELALPARVLEVDLGAKGVWYRVVVGATGSAAEASALREQLKKKGIPDGVVQGF
jgi:cell division protein FtsN